MTVTGHLPVSWGTVGVYVLGDPSGKIFGKSDDYFNGYFSPGKEITDLDEDLIAATITEDDLTKISRQLDVSMGEMFQLINVFSVILFALVDLSADQADY